MTMKRQKVELIKRIISGKVDTYLMSLGIVHALDETVLITQKDEGYFIEGVQVDPDKIECNKAIMPDNDR